MQPRRRRKWKTAIFSARFSCVRSLGARTSRPHCGTGLAFLARSFPLECLCTTNPENVCACTNFCGAFWLRLCCAVSSVIRRASTQSPRRYSVRSVLLSRNFVARREDFFACHLPQATCHSRPVWLRPCRARLRLKGPRSQRTHTADPGENRPAGEIPRRHVESLPAA